MTTRFSFIISFATHYGWVRCKHNREFGPSLVPAMYWSLLANKTQPEKMMTSEYLNKTHGNLFQFQHISNSVFFYQNSFWFVYKTSLGKCQTLCPGIITEQNNLSVFNSYQISQFQRTWRCHCVRCRFTCSTFSGRLFIFTFRWFLPFFLFSS